MTTTTPDTDDRPIEFDLADAVLDELYKAFGEMTGCPVEDTDVKSTLQEALVIALTHLHAAHMTGFRIRCGFCGAKFGDSATCPQGCAEQDVNGGTGLAHRVIA